MKSFVKGFIVFFIAAFVLSFFYSYTKRTLNTSAVKARYDGTNFTMIVPAGSTPVTLKNTTKPVGEQQMVQNAYSFQNGSVSYSIFAYEYSNHAENTPEEVSRTTVSHLFNDGYSATFSDSHLGELSAVVFEVEGTTTKGEAAFIRTRLDGHSRSPKPAVFSYSSSRGVYGQHTDQLSMSLDGKSLILSLPLGPT